VSHAVVTGGGSGIGLAVVRRLADRGVSVSVLDVDGAALERLPGGAVHGFEVDVADAAAVRAAIADAVDAAGPADALVTCAGTKGRRVPALETDEASWRRLMDVHLYGTWAACRAFAELRQSGAGDAAIVTISSIVAANGFTFMLDYGTAKAAVEYITRVLAVEWAPLGIRVNAVAPGYTATPMVGAMQSEGFDLGPVEARTPMGRLAEPDETARVVEFLCYDAGFVTGTVVRVDGGWTAVGR
jgi:NAD(P)-dependent dehydrogenase (short-subunit alcohol dehydrogenase family)